MEVPAKLITLEDTVSAQRDGMALCVILPSVIASV